MKTWISFLCRFTIYTDILSVDLMLHINVVILKKYVYTCEYNISYKQLLFYFHNI